MGDKDSFVDIIQSIGAVATLLLLLIEGIKKLIEAWKDDGTEEAKKKKEELEEKLTKYQTTYDTMVALKESDDIKIV